MAEQGSVVGPARTWDWGAGHPPGGWAPRGDGERGPRRWEGGGCSSPQVPRGAAVRGARGVKPSDPGRTVRQTTVSLPAAGAGGASSAHVPPAGRVPWNPDLDPLLEAGGLGGPAGMPLAGLHLPLGTTPWALPEPPPPLERSSQAAFRPVELKAWVEGRTRQNRTNALFSVHRRAGGSVCSGFIFIF